MDHTVGYGLCQGMAKTQLGKEEWVEAALAAWLSGSLADVAVESLARTLGVTKGSFYWHFRDREELVDAVLATWETRAADDPIRLFETLPPREALHALFAFLEQNLPLVRGEAAIRANVQSERVGAAVARVMRKRVAFLERTYAALGASSSQAKQSALLGLAAYLGTVDLMATLPDLLAAERAFARYVRHAEAVLVDGALK
jgi:AcrR family transcriptional regulator